MSEPVLDGDEVKVGSWRVFMGDPSPNGAKMAGRLIVTNRHVRFQADFMLTENAAAKLGNRRSGITPSNEAFALPFEMISSVSVVRKWVILKTLNINLRDGIVIPVHFGAMSATKAVEAIELGMRAQ